MILLLLSWAAFAAQELSPIEVLADPKAKTQTRSVEWPIQQDKAPTQLVLPSLDESLNLLNGVQSRSQGSPSFSIRGSGQSGRSLLLYNGIPLNFSSGFGAPQIFFAKEAVDSVEVIKGPSSLFYGSQGLAGSLNFAPRIYQNAEWVTTLSDTDESFLPHRNGRLAFFANHFAAPLLKGPDHHWQVSLYNETDDGAFPFQGPQASGARDFNASNLSRVVTQGEHHHKKLSLYFDGIVGRQIRQSPGPINLPLRTREETDGLLVSLTPQYFFAGQTFIKSRLSYMNSDSEFSESGTPSDNRQISLISQNELNLQISAKHKLQLFVDQFSHQLDNSFVGNGLSQDFFEIGPFYQFKPNNTWTWQMGGRYLAQADAFLPSLSLRWQNTVLEQWLSYSEGFRYPSLTDQFANSPFFIGNPSLESEQSNQVEWGLRWPRGQAGALNPFSSELRLFIMNYSQFIESFEASPGIFSRENRGAGRAQGVDLTANYDSDPLRLHVSYNYLDTEIRDSGAAFRLAPRHQLSWGGNYSFRYGRFEWQNIHWYDFEDVSFQGNTPLPDWQQWNFFYGCKLFESTDLTLGLINAFNEYKELTLNYPESGRRYWLQVRQQF